MSTKAIEGVNKIKDGYNPATSMLEVSSSAQEMALGVDFTKVYKSSELYRCNDPVSVVGFMPGFMYGSCMNDCGPGLMDMLFD